MIPQTAQNSLSQKALPPHLHIEDDTCPVCEQDIPPDKLEEVRGKIAARQHEHARAITIKLEAQFASHRAEADAKATEMLEDERKQSAVREAAVREETRLAVEKAMQAAEQVGNDLRLELEKQGRDHATALANAKTEAETRETEVRAQAQFAADALATQKIETSETVHSQRTAALQAQLSQAEEAVKSAEEKNVFSANQIAELRKSNESEIAKLRADAAAEAILIRQNAVAEAETQMRESMIGKDTALADAQTKVAEAQKQIFDISEQYQSELCAQREVMEKAKDEAVGAVESKAFAETQKHLNKVNELQRALDKKTSEELGEGAEVNLFEDLKQAFPDDRIERIAKGAPGADVIQEVMLNGKSCGKIIYDSKNHKQFRTDHVTKLRTDQLAEKAEHAILSTHKFPQGTQQVYIDDGVVLANPSRVVMIVTLLRQSLVQIHALRLSGVEREGKTAKLYEFITSDLCTQHFKRIDERAEALLEHQAKEMRWHENHWKNEGTMLRDLQKANANLQNEVGQIIGIAESDEASLRACAS